MFKKTCKFFLVFFLALITLSCSKNETLTIGVTTTLEDSGLLSELVKSFEKNHQLKIKPVVSASGQIHELIRRGDLDFAITHDPQGEKLLFSEGFIQQPIPFIQNDFFIVGPEKDPAHIKLTITPDEALEKILFTKSLFVSRSDNSGTHQMERYWWDKARLDPESESYIKTGTGMGATLTLAAERNAYTLVDRGTWLNFANKQELSVLFENQDQLINRYSLLKVLEPKTTNNENLNLWVNWLTSAAAQELVVNYRINEQEVFHLSR
jgi:tungstate transport system substrate-binding protein